MAYETLQLEPDNGLLWLVLNRPDKLNAFTSPDDLPQREPA